MLSPLTFRCKGGMRRDIGSVADLPDGVWRTIGAERCNRWERIIRKNPIAGFLRICFGDPLGARTQDPNIKSVVLYQLS